MAASLRRNPFSCIPVCIFSLLVAEYLIFVNPSKNAVLNITANIKLSYRNLQAMTQRQLFLAHVGQTSEAPLALEIVKAKGSSMWDINGKKYIDLIAGISVCNVGHCHPKVIEAIKKQVDQYMHIMVYGELVESPQVA